MPPFKQSIPYHHMPKSDESVCSSGMHADEEDGTLLEKEPKRRSLRNRHVCSYVIVAVMSLLVGLLGGQLFRVNVEIDGYMEPYGQGVRHLRNVVWYDNTTFSDDLSETSEAAWASLIPEGQGFVRNPYFAKEMKSISAFHEIHCLHNIRTAYFMSQYLYQKSQHASSSAPLHPATHDHPSIPATPFTPNAYIEANLDSSAHHLDTHHIKHCFEYLRQALMCAADSNLEDTHSDTLGGEEVTGAPGWGSKRVCRDFEVLKAWSETWRSSRDGVK